MPPEPEPSHGPHYLDTLSKLVGGERVEWDDFIAHFDAQNANPAPGPAIGDRLPELAMPDQEGTRQSFASLSGDRGLLLVLVRSAHWCGYCRNQLGELNLALARARAAGFNIAAIAPDAPELVAEFAQAANLEYPILADAGARYAEKIGLLNGNLAGAELQNGGRVPFPAHLLVSSEGKVLARSVTEDLRHRPSGTNLIFAAAGPDAGSPAIHIDGGEVKAEILFSTDTVHTGQEVALLLRLHIAEGWHVYGPNDHGRYAELKLEFDDPLIEAQHITLPPATPTSFPDTGETIPAYQGELSAPGSLRLRWSPPVHGSRHLVGLTERLEAIQTAPGRHDIKGRLCFQACGEGICQPPRTLSFSVTLTVRPDIDKARAFFAAEKQHADAN